MSPTIVTKIGGDGLGDGMISELQQDGVDTRYVLRAAGQPSPFTYIIVDKEGGTRTCIHTPGAPLTPEDLVGPGGTQQQQLDDILDGAALVYFDGRLLEAALLLATRARQRGIPVLVEAERLRPGLERLLALADYVVTSAHFPQEWTGELELPDAVLETARRLPASAFVITTMGARGSMMLCREQSSSDGGGGGSGPAASSLKQVVSELEAQLSSGGPLQGEAQGGCLSRTGVQIRAGAVACSAGPLLLGFSEGRSPEAAAAQVLAAAAHVAALEADPGNAARYVPTATATAAGTPAAAGGLMATVLRATAAALPKEAVVDTTGAGDSFIGSVLYGLAIGLSYPRMLQLAGVVAACKCTEMGARAGLPRRDALSPDLLE